MPILYALKDDSEDIKAIALKNTFIKDNLEVINKLSFEQLKIFIAIIAQLGEESLLLHTMDKIDNEEARARIEQALSEESVDLKRAYKYDTLETLGFDIGDAPKERSPVGEVLYQLEDTQKKNRGIVVTSQGNYKVESNIFAKYLNRRLCLTRKKDDIYVYSEGIYIPLQDIELKKICRDILNEVDETVWRKRFESEYIDALKMEVRTVDSLDSTEDMVAFNNGYLNLKSGEFKDFTPDLYFSTKLNFDYDPKAEAPRFKKFLEEIFDGDIQLIKLMEEILGYLLYQDKKIHKMYIFKGSGSNGKSVLIKVIENLLGRENISNTPLKKLGGKFGLQDLEGKLVNISSENELGSNIDTENIKAIVGGDRVEIEKKNQDSYAVTLGVRLIAAVNNDFYFSDNSVGILRRLLLIPFRVRFHEAPLNESDRVPGLKYQDNNLENELLNESPGIFNIAYRGLQRLRGNNFIYTESDACKAELDRYKSYSDPIKTFIEDELTVGENLQVERSRLNDLFEKWQRENAGYYKPIQSRGAAKQVKEKLESDGRYTLEKTINGRRFLVGVGEEFSNHNEAREASKDQFIIPRS